MTFAIRDIAVLIPANGYPMVMLGRMLSEAAAWIGRAGGEERRRGEMNAHPAARQVSQSDPLPNFYATKSSAKPTETTDFDPTAMLAIFRFFFSFRGRAGRLSAILMGLWAFLGLSLLPVVAKSPPFQGNIGGQWFLVIALRMFCSASATHQPLRGAATGVNHFVHRAVLAQGVWCSAETTASKETVCQPGYS